MGGHLPDRLVLQRETRFRNTKYCFEQFFILSVFLELEANLTPTLLVFLWQCFGDPVVSPALLLQETIIVPLPFYLCSVKARRSN